MSDSSSSWLMRPAPSGSVAERRQGFRFACTDVFCLVTIAEDARRFPARVRDISLKGIALETEAPALPGDSIDLFVYTDVANLSYNLRATVLRVMPLPEGNWLLGCISVD
jgi:hypothetical protein